MIDSIALRVATRFTAKSQMLVRAEHGYAIGYLPQHAGVVEDIVIKVNKALAMYRAAGIPIQHDLAVRLHGSGASHADAMYDLGSNPPLVTIAPKAYRDPNLTLTIIHEFGHYMHDKVVPGRTGNFEIQRRFSWARQQQATGEGPQLDVLRRRAQAIENELRVLADAKYKLKPMPKKGEVFDYGQWVNGRQFPFKVRIIKKSGQRVTLEVLNPEVIPYAMSGYFPVRGGKVLVEVDVKTLLFQGTDPEVEARIRALEAERTKVYDEMKAIARTEKDDRYRVQRHEWMPTRYSRKDPLEWFAELCTTFVLGHLNEPVGTWLLSVIKTGEAPDGMKLT